VVHYSRLPKDLNTALMEFEMHHWKSCVGIILGSSAVPPAVHGSESAVAAPSEVRCPNCFDKFGRKHYGLEFIGR